MPILQQLFVMLFNYPAQPIDFLPAEAVTTLQTNWVEPKLGLAVIALNVDVWRFTAIAGVEEDAIWPNSKYGWHAVILPYAITGL
jgi:hypothetical protein